PVMDLDAAEPRPGADHDEARPDVTDEIRRFWDEDAATYDNSPSHYPQRPQEQAAWASALRRLLPDPPATVLDVGAGTGFLSLLLASLGYEVTAQDLSPGMLARLRDKADARGLSIKTVESDALHPPQDEFGAVVERHLLWTLLDPVTALAAWHAVAPDGRLVVIEGSWGGRSTTGLEMLRSRARELADRIRRLEQGHHGHYSEQMRTALPYRGGLTPAEAVAVVQASPWGAARIERLRDVEWAVIEGRGLLDEMLGTHARWAVIAGR
ncbi:MAG: class I SAM-dependent methyltransferase, partial [Streptosporangiaceae bacterium]